MKNNIPKAEVIFTKKGRLIEFPFLDRYSIVFLLKRLLGFLFDYAIYATIVVAVHTLLFNLDGDEKNIQANIAISMTMGWLIYTIYTSLSSLMLGGATMGQKLFGASPMHYTGFRSGKYHMFMRAQVAALYATPILGFALLFASMVMVFIFKGISAVDLLTKTTTVTIGLKNDLTKIEDNYYLEKRMKN